MSLHLLLLGLGLLALQQTGETPPSAEAVAQAEARLDQAFRSGEVANIAAALEAAQAVRHPAVVRKVERGLEDERVEVKLAVLQTLRWLDHPETLRVLHRAAKDRRLMQSPELALAVLRATGQHAAPGSVAVLAHDPFRLADAWCLRARIFGLARIRTREALEALLGLLAAVGPGGQRQIQGQIADVRIALVFLTGVDHGRSPELWEQWWREHGKSFRVPPEPVRLAPEMQAVWDAFWGERRAYERGPRREDRGQDPPPHGK